MDKTITVAAPQDAPAPLAIFTQEVIHPENIALEERLKRAEPMGWLETRRVNTRVRVLHRQLERADFWVLLSQYRSLTQQLETLRTAFIEQRDYLKRVQGRPQIKDWREQVSLYQTMKAQGTALTQRRNAVTKALRDIAPIAKEYQQLCQRIHEHNELMARAAEESQREREMSNEADIIAELFQLKWAKLENCHHRWKDEKGNWQTDVPGFVKVDITPDTIWYQIEASHKGMFHWHDDIPYGVHIDSLVDERTLIDLSAACKRQVTAVRNFNGVWLKVNRLDSPDGLLNYISYKNVMEYYPTWAAELMPFPAGIVTNRKVRWVNFAEWPHMLVAGYTQSGKSTFVNNIACTLITRHSPAELRVMLIDMKGGVEFEHYKGLPHALGDTIVNVTDVPIALQQIIVLMQQRFEKLRSAHAKDIWAYNSRVADADKMPRIVIFVDEMANFIGKGELTREIHNQIALITAQGRACGIHMVLCTQHPSTKVIPGEIKTNLGVRVSGRMPTGSASITVLGIALAREIAAVPGRMLIMMGPDPEEIQTPHVTDEDIKSALRAAQLYEPVVLELPDVSDYKPEQWTPEKIIAFSVRHLNGNLSGLQVWRGLKDERSISQRQTYKLVEAAQQMATEIPIEVDGKFYQLQSGTKGKEKHLVAVVPQLESGA